MLKSGDLGLCKYGENCTFAYNQLEIDVWTEERKGTLDRNLLFGAEDGKLDPVNSIICLLRENKGMFIFLCQVSCYICCQRLENKLFEDSAIFLEGLLRVKMTDMFQLRSNQSIKQLIQGLKKTYLMTDLFFLCVYPILNNLE